MNMKEKMEILEDVMDVEELHEDMRLNDIEEWDSLSILTLTAKIYALYGCNLTRQEIQAFETVNDICKYLDKCES